MPSVVQHTLPVKALKPVTNSDINRMLAMNSSTTHIHADNDDYTIPAGSFDNLTIMRYAHIYRNRTSGGVEQYLRYLNRGLLLRHRLTILQMHLIREHESNTIEVENVGLGSIIWIPITIMQSSSRIADLPGRLSYMLGRSFQQSQNGVMARRFMILPSKRSMSCNWGAHLRYKAAIFSDYLRQLFEIQKIDLLALHWMSYDAGPIIKKAIKSQVPFVFVNHFNNDKLSHPATRKWLDRAAGIGVVSALNIPENLLGRCFNLSDAVDTDYFTLEKARPLNFTNSLIVLMPARIVKHKGHKDLIEAARILIARKIDLVLCFVGAVDSETLNQELRRIATDEGIKDKVFFLGEKSAEEIRDCYATSCVVALPSYSEGLPRVLLEAQSMEKPFVAYNNGGMKEAVIPGKTGFLVQTGDVTALADRLAYLLSNEVERRRMGKCGREFVTLNFSISSLIKRHEMFYYKALSHDAGC